MALSNYPTHGKRALVNRAWFRELGVDTDQEIGEVLGGNRVSLHNADLVGLARSVVGTGNYILGSPVQQIIHKPMEVDCSSLICWLYNRNGVSLPRASIDQMELGVQITRSAIKPGDLVFTTGPQNYFIKEPREPSAVGHVALATGEGTVIHSVKRRRRPAIEEIPLDQLLGEDRELRGYVRILPHPDNRLLLIAKGHHRNHPWSRDWVREVQRGLKPKKRRR